MLPPSARHSVAEISWFPLLTHFQCYSKVISSETYPDYTSKSSTTPSSHTQYLKVSYLLVQCLSTQLELERLTHDGRDLDIFTADTRQERRKYWLYS